MSEAPRVRPSYSFENGEILLHQGHTSFVVNCRPEHQETVKNCLSRTFAGEPIDSTLESSVVDELMCALKEHGLVPVNSECDGLRGVEALLTLEDYANELLYSTLYQNVFWRHIQRANSRTIPEAVIYGFVIENYHFLYRESWFDSPALSFVTSKAAQKLMNQFYGEEYGHDELLLRSLESIGITREQLDDTIPLQATSALYNSLAYWASFDPVFFFTTLGILEGKDIVQDSFLDACEAMGLPDKFVGPLRMHSEINLKGGHGALSRALFRHIPVVGYADLDRMKSSTALFVGLYDAFYSAVWRHYTSSASLLRKVAEV